MKISRDAVSRIPASLNQGRINAMGWNVKDSSSNRHHVNLRPGQKYGFDLQTRGTRLPDRTWIFFCTHRPRHRSLCITPAQKRGKAYLPRLKPGR
jgi:hypothetical protein